CATSLATGYFDLW
nr:immunoglobulin heavy chain junction region [Macaca mulatta]MOY26780.1 immunoglobulin heavy chain junction region [Macaca mulatta]